MDILEIWPGPMEGVGRKEFVDAVSALGLVDRWMTPFIRITDTIPSPGKLKKYVQPYLASGVPVTIQLMGNDPVLLGECGQFLLTLPGTEGINLNMGCPSNRVVHHHAGGGMLREPEKIADFCSQVAGMLPPGKLSLKIRSGFTSPEDMKIFLPALAAENKIAKLFFHYRTVSEAYSSIPLPRREERIKLAVQLCGNIPVIANGDIDSPADAEKIIKTTGASGVMIARSWMRDPYLLRRLAGSDQPEAEDGREKFFSQLTASGVRGGALLEMAKMLWGSTHPRFRELLPGK